MKKDIFLIIFLFVPLIILGKDPDSSKSLMYLGQTPPGKIPEVFAPGIISDAGFRLHSFPSFSPDGKEIYWSVIPPNVYFVKIIEGEWSKPKIAEFSQKNIQAPFISYDSERIYFQMSDNGGFGNVDLWFTRNTRGGVDNLQNLGSPPNTNEKESQPTLTEEGTLYFVSKLDGVAWQQGIYSSKLINGKYVEPVLLDQTINTKYIDGYPFVSQDESFLIFSSSRPSLEERDLKLFVSFRDNDGKWEVPICLSDKLGLNAPVRYGSVSPDNKYLFYLMNNQFYWVDINVITQLNK